MTDGGGEHSRRHPRPGKARQRERSRIIRDTQPRGTRPAARRSTRLHCRSRRRGRRSLRALRRVRRPALQIIPHGGGVRHVDQPARQHVRRRGLRPPENPLPSGCAGSPFRRLLGALRRPSARPARRRPAPTEAPVAQASVTPAARPRRPGTGSPRTRRASAFSPSRRRRPPTRGSFLLHFRSGGVLRTKSPCLFGAGRMRA